ncbi:MAG: hypothetical protein J6S67_18705 [Methanobrevibacter sp.]|nr:hypothetical protein [Methanobrevibacter sp.]
MTDYKVRIYSNEHHAWWAPKYNGYTTDKAKAGVYTMSVIMKRYPEVSFDVTGNDYFVIIDNFGDYVLNYIDLNLEISSILSVPKSTFYAVLNECVDRDICFKFELQDEHCATTLTVDNVFDWSQLLEIRNEVEADNYAKIVKA